MASSLVLASLWATVAIAQRPGHAPYQHAGLFDHPNPTAGQPSRYQDWSNGDPSDAQKHWGVENFSGFTKDAENCLSELGTIQAGTLPQFKTDNPLPAGFPWGQKNLSTNYYFDYPYTGVTRYYDWTVEQQDCAPDGVNMTCLLVNGQYPGPLIEANWGDQIQVKVTNNAPEGTAIHWHGILQKDNQAFDGVPGVSQCPIAPGKSFTYTWTAELYGTSWWHGHYSSQYASGLSGPMVIYGPHTSDYDIDLGPVVVTDWYHSYYSNLLSGISVPLADAPVYPYAQNVLINGKNPYDCKYVKDTECTSAPMAQFSFTSGKTHRLRLVNTGADATMKISIDGHDMQVIANDFVPIEPYTTSVVTLGVGQRADVLVKGIGAPQGAYYMRVNSPDPCGTNNGQPNAWAAVYYEAADKSQLPFSEPQPGWNNTYCGNDDLSLSRPVMVQGIDENPTSVDIEMEGHSNGTHGKWWMNGVSSMVDYDEPILLKSKLKMNDFPVVRGVYQYDSSHKAIRFIVKNKSGNPHPMHMHGHNMFILAQGSLDNDWNGTIVNADNPARRDVQIVGAWEYLVVQWNQDNPGAWPFHCHLAWHLSLGMAIEVLESPDLIPDQVKTPSTVSQTCRDWWAWDSHNVVDQIDSGI